jgi:hypothetical protein
MKPQDYNAIKTQLDRFSSDSGDKRTWTREDREKFRIWLKKYLKRHSECREEMMPNIPKRVNNTDIILEKVTRHVCISMDIVLIWVTLICLSLGN